MQSHTKCRFVLLTSKFSFYSTTVKIRRNVIMLVLLHAARTGFSLHSFYDYHYYSAWDTHCRLITLRQVIDIIRMLHTYAGDDAFRLYIAVDEGRRSSFWLSIFDANSSRRWLPKQRCAAFCITLTADTDICFIIAIRVRRDTCRWCGCFGLPRH